MFNFYRILCFFNVHRWCPDMGMEVIENKKIKYFHATCIDCGEQGSFERRSYNG